MSIQKISIQFASINKIWAFKQETKLNSFYLDAATLTITFELPGEDIGWAITKHCGRVVNEKETA